MEFVRLWTRKEALSKGLGIGLRIDFSLLDVGGSERFARDAPASRLTAIRLDGMYHEIFNEVDRDRALLPLREWLRATFRARV